MTEKFKIYYSLIDVMFILFFSLSFSFKNNIITLRRKSMMENIFASLSTTQKEVQKLFTQQREREREKDK